MLRQNLADDQAIDSRFGEAVWLTDFVTPDNPDVRLLFDRLTEGLNSQREKIIACWRYVANIPYRQSIKARITVNGKSQGHSDVWLYPAEVISLAPFANCANKSFLLASLLRNELPESQVSCVFGHIDTNGIGAHAWVNANFNGGNYFLETTIPDVEKAMVLAESVEVYEPVIYFNDGGVYTVSKEVSVAQIVNEKFGFCAIPWLKDYVCERCLELEV